MKIPKNIKKEGLSDGRLYDISIIVPYYNEGENGASFYLIGNRNIEGHFMIPQKGIDYFLLTKELFDEERLQQIASALRSISGIQGVFLVKMGTIKNLDLMIENLELHELEKVIKPGKEGSAPYLR